ncbi:hypothetical protein IE4872_CH02963 [Rhizobium gallicum]|uniref:Uncharacterized protein n=1 Tax=Rhizobium gallicum TaxID=56730 RepID=A0A1L5NKX5_9HYPH|nr:hypothetical protein IE4872_CH02963 [Rhizobium gallicum]
MRVAADADAKHSNGIKRSFSSGVWLIACCPPAPSIAAPILALFAVPAGRIYYPEQTHTPGRTRRLFEPFFR